MDKFGTSPADSLTEEQQAASRLLQVLKQEQALLIEANIDQLAALTEQKSKLVARMTELAGARHRALGSAGFDARESGMQAWLANTPASAAIAKSWNELLELARAAKELNRTNGVLINRQMTRNQETLSVLQGNRQGGNFYGPNGQSTTKTTTRGLVVG